MKESQFNTDASIKPAQASNTVGKNIGHFFTVIFTCFTGLDSPNLDEPFFMWTSRDCVYFFPKVS